MRKTKESTESKPHDEQETHAIGSVSSRFLASSALSLLGNSISSVALPLALLVTTGDALAAGAIALICMLPQAVAGVIGGAALDILNRRDVSVISDLVSAMSVAMLPVIDATIGLSFGWFVVFGLIGAVGDIPGMTARDALLPAVCKKDRVDMQRFVGLSQSADSLIMIIGPSTAAFIVGLSGPITAFTVTAITSTLAACITLFIPREVGKIPSQTIPNQGTITRALESATSGLRTLFLENPFLRTCIVFTLLMIAALGGFQGLVLPVYFVEIERADLLGFVLAAISSGILIGTSAYSILAKKLSHRTWYAVSLLGMLFGMVIMAFLPTFLLLLLGAVMLGFFSGPFSALLGFRMLEAIPDEVRGSVLGIQNSLLLIVSPTSVFIASVLTSLLGVGATAMILAAAWLAFTVYALTTRSMRDI